MDNKSDKENQRTVATSFMDELDDLLLEVQDEWKEPFTLTGSLADAYKNTMF